ncbi:uncharacterized protein BKA55DRAFT_567204 [Fusarium redolens]|uniref:Uncharacterized protein n=1 Tax=Fusarium redolens TaxID=48865 RepID=A0A9P9HAY3_FUSRE|nr:uncharacterized protein BKA55DRAFT_567204 [Fusarium redolens]KAH7254206.1 hypothetical protein BKA55DRAFT_567204 [Fusarium redolens]
MSHFRQLMSLGSRSFVTRALASLRICFPSSFTPSTSVLLDAYWWAISTLLGRLEVVEIMGAFVGVVNSRAWVGINVNANFLRLVTQIQIRDICSVKVLLTKARGQRALLLPNVADFTRRVCLRIWFGTSRKWRNGSRKGVQIRGNCSTLMLNHFQEL